MVSRNRKKEDGVMWPFKKRVPADLVGNRLASLLLDADACWRDVCMLRGYKVPGPVATCEMVFVRAAIIRDTITRNQTGRISEVMLSEIDLWIEESFVASEDTEVTLKHYGGEPLSVIAPRTVRFYQENVFPLTQLASVFGSRLTVPGMTSIEIAPMFEHVASTAEQIMKLVKIVPSKAT